MAERGLVQMEGVSAGRKGWKGQGQRVRAMIGCGVRGGVVGGRRRSTPR